MYKFKKIFSLLIVIVLITVALTACSPDPVVETDPTEVPEEPTEEVVVVEPTEEMGPVYEEQPWGDNLPTAATIDTPLVVAYADFSQKFSPFFADSGYDFDVVGMVLDGGVLTTDRVGGIIPNAIVGETVSYNGVDHLYRGSADTSVVYDEATDTTKYTARLRVGMKFSDGMPVTIDDLIFTYYTLLDPAFVGSSTLGSYEIVGLQDYKTQTTSDVFDKYNAMAADIFAAGPDHAWTDADTWTQEHQDDFWTKHFDAHWTYEVGAINTLCNTTYAGYAEGFSLGTEGGAIAWGISCWGYGGLEEDGSFVTAFGVEEEMTFDMVETFPTLEDAVNLYIEMYAGDFDAFYGVEGVSDPVHYANAVSNFVALWGPLDESMGGEGVPNITGIVRVDDYTVEVTVNGFSAPAVYSILGQQVAPLHYYGDADLYDYENDMFGFEYGDLSLQHSKTANPMGMGPYKFLRYENRIVYFEANEYYYKGCPAIAEIQFKETDTDEVPSAVQTGTADSGEMSYSASRYAEVSSYNANGEMTGDVITTSMVDNLGYGYIGLNADTMSVGGEAGSEASKNLRRAFATILSVYRDVAIDSYYGNAASVINYPISNTSWAAPQPTDEGYELAFSTDVDGAPIFTADMSYDDKYAAAKVAALDFFEAAGFTVEAGVITAAPEGAKLSYELIIIGDGVGDHPSFAIVTMAKEAFAEMGMELVINDPADGNVLWNALDAGTQEMWAAAWGSTIDPDMYQIYHSSGIVGRGGSDSNHYHVDDADLDQLIVDGRLSDDQSYRKAVYKQALEKVIEWAVELPTYQRQNVIIFSTPRLNIDSLTPDITTFWGWLSDVELVEMN